MILPEIAAKIERELQAAEDSLAAGNEAKARVCARRAAGAALQAYYTVRDGLPAEPNAYALLQRLQQDPNAPQDWKKTAGILLTRVEKDYSFPIKSDLLSETRQLIQSIDANLKGSRLD